MPNTLHYVGRASGWTLAEYKTLLDDLAGYHDPASGRRVTSLDWNVGSDEVFVGIDVEDTAPADIPTEQTAISDVLADAPNAWPTGDETFRWG